MLSAHSRLQVSPRMRRDTSQLLLIVSDGRGIFLEGMEVSKTVLKKELVMFTGKGFQIPLVSNVLIVASFLRFKAELSRLKLNTY